MCAPLGPSFTRNRPTVLGSLGLLTSFAFLVSCGSSEPPVVPPLEIEVVEVVQRDQPIELVMVGETRGSSDIPIRARVEGVVTGMYFAEGRLVEEDQLLYTIDPEPFQQEVVEAEGGVAEQDRKDADGIRRAEERRQLREEKKKRPAIG